MFVNTLALRNQVEEDLSFKEFILKVKENVLNAYTYQMYPFDTLVNKLNIKRDISRNPLFDVMFIYQNNHYSNINFDGMEATYNLLDAEISKFDLSLEAFPQDNEIKLSFEYATKLFSEEFIKNMSCHYLQIINTILENIEIRLINNFETIYNDLFKNQVEENNNQ